MRRAQQLLPFLTSSSRTPGSLCRVSGAGQGVYPSSEPLRQHSGSTTSRKGMGQLGQRCRSGAAGRKGRSCFSVPRDVGKPHPSAPRVPTPLPRSEGQHRPSQPTHLRGARRPGPWHNSSFQRKSERARRELAARFQAVGAVLQSSSHVSALTEGMGTCRWGCQLCEECNLLCIV